MHLLCSVEVDTYKKEHGIERRVGPYFWKSIIPRFQHYIGQLDLAILITVADI